LAVIATLVFAPAAVAQQMEDEMMGDDKMMEQEMMMEDDMMSSASASAMSSVSAMSSASAMDDEMMSGSASASASALPGTGGPQLLPLLSIAALVAIVGSGIVAARLVRTNS
jgi:hypothetical protein